MRVSEFVGPPLIARMILPFLLLLNGCHSMQNDSYSIGFDYDYYGIVCPVTGNTAEGLFQSVRREIEVLISTDSELSAAVGVIDFREPTLIGYKKAKKQLLVQFLFGKFLRHDVVLPGEGGVLVVVEACDETIIDASFFRMPG